MVYLNALVLACYAFFGMMLLAGYLFNSGTLIAVTAISGWFLVVYSLGAYVLAALLQFLRRSQGFWAALYPVNCSLALGAILLFGISGPSIVVALLAAAVLGASAGMLIRRSTLANMRALPLAAPVPLLLCLLPRIGPYWILPFSFVAAFLMMNCVDTRLMQRRSS